MFLLCAFTTGCIGPRHLFGAYHGTIVDSETKAPIEGAVIVVWWEKCLFLQMDGCGTPHSVRETVTGPSGEFSIWAARDLIWNPLGYANGSRAKIAIYAVDYLPLGTNYRTVPGFEGDAVEFEAKIMRGDSIPLRRPENPLELRQYANRGLVSSKVEEPDVPELFRAINRQSRKIGLLPIGDEHRHGERVR
jgi:hypothetical protein